ncbi:MAG: DUF1501 domain-containing protein [Verrucomicrobia bacterium]|nr:DUF1501 domain-containing protein [Verrucomicrobiota bacterium]
MMQLNRRYFLTMLGGFPLVPSILSAAPLRGKSPRSLILLWMDGGMSHIDTLDAKPEAPPDIRGDLGTLRASVNGVFVGEHLPRIGAMMKDCALVRSITSPEGNHDRGSHFMLTGRQPSPVLEYPSLGSVLGTFRPESITESSNGLPPYVAIPDAHPYARQGFLPVANAPFELAGDPSNPDFRVKHLQPIAGMDRTLRLLDRLDALDAGPQSESEAARDAFLAQGRYLSLNSDVRALFDLGDEKQEVRNRYGRHFFGQSCLLARRLVQGGVRTVMVRYTGWDHHSAITNAMTYGFPPKLPALDEGISALHEDLERRALLDDVLVVLASEFGRTPRINPGGGRDHWSRASSVLLFGAGIQKGSVHGTTDARGEEPASDPVSPQDLYATMMTALGADVSKVLYTPDGRPIRIAPEDARVIPEILSEA